MLQHGRANVGSVLRPLSASFFDRPALEVAPDLIGCLLVRRHRGRLRVCRLVETEAYLGPHDLASHSRMGKTARNAPMFGPPGRAYVYLIYGLHHCVNAVCGPGRFPSAVLLRAAAPVEPVEPVEPAEPDAETSVITLPLLHSATGPGNLCRALGIKLAQNRADLSDRDGALFVAEGASERPAVVAGPRIGVDYAGEWSGKPYRFCERGSAHVSRPRPPA
jgi:DNA-3-methyladenine glycosylase